MLARLALLALLLALALPPAPAAAATLQALPPTVRVNVAGLGTVSARIGSTGTVRVMASDGAVLYRGTAATVARTDVYRLSDDSVPIPDRDTPTRDRDEWLLRRHLLFEARLAERELGPIGALLVVPFELSVLSPADPIGERLLRAERVVGIRYEAEDGLLTFNGKVFRGTLELALDSAGDMIVVNEVPTREYLASVVGSEIPTTWHPEAIAAQAIAARTYLLTHLRRNAGYDLEGDVRDQAYDGFGRETRETLRAVDRTAGLVATYRGAAIEALYSANAGGVTEDSENVYPNALPYLRGVPSPWDDVASISSWGRTSWEWTRELTAPQLGAFLRRRGIDVGEPEGIELLDVAPSGRVMRARVVGTGGSRVIGKDASRFYFGLRSSLYTVEKRPGGDAESVGLHDAERVRQLEGLGALRVGTGYRIERGPDRTILRIRETAHVYELPDRFVFSGRGFGHGVGMSQWGMQGMAEAGASAEEILKHYYTGIELMNVGGD